MSRLILGSLLILALFAGACGGTGADGEAFDRAGLERHEDLSEALANDLLKLSIAVRDRDYEKIENFVAPAIRATASCRKFPASPHIAVITLQTVRPTAMIERRTPRSASRAIGMPATV